VATVPRRACCSPFAICVAPVPKWTTPRMKMLPSCQFRGDLSRRFQFLFKKPFQILLGLLPAAEFGALDAFIGMVFVFTPACAHPAHTVSAFCFSGLPAPRGPGSWTGGPRDSPLAPGTLPPCTPAPGRR